LANCFAFVANRDTTFSVTLFREPKSMIIPQLQKTFEELTYQKETIPSKNSDYLDLAERRRGIQGDSDRLSLMNQPQKDKNLKKPFTSKQLNALRSYESQSAAMNSDLRSDKSLYGSANAEEVHEIDTALHERMVDGHAYKGLTMRGIGPTGMKYAKNLQPGDIHQDKAFLSTSESKKALTTYTNDFCRGGLAIYAFGKSGIPVTEDIFTNRAKSLRDCAKDEQEVLYPRNTAFNILFKHNGAEYLKHTDHKTLQGLYEKYGGNFLATSIIQDEVGKQYPRLQDRRKNNLIADVSPCF
jgi:hypothetical protein